MVTIAEAHALYEIHRAEMLRISRQAALDLYVAGSHRGITAQDAFAYLRDNQLLTEEQLSCNRRWIAGMFNQGKDGPWVKVGLRTVSDKQRNCNGTLRGVWRLKKDVEREERRKGRSR